MEQPPYINNNTEYDENDENDADHQDLQPLSLKYSLFKKQKKKKNAKSLALQVLIRTTWKCANQSILNLTPMYASVTVKLPHMVMAGP